MKKLFALMLVVAMLAVAGSAMAAGRGFYATASDDQYATASDDQGDTTEQQTGGEGTEQTGGEGTEQTGGKGTEQTGGEGTEQTGNDENADAITHNQTESNDQNGENNNQGGEDNPGGESSGGTTTVSNVEVVKAEYRVTASLTVMRQISTTITARFTNASYKAGLVSLLRALFSGLSFASEEIMTGDNMLEVTTSNFVAGDDEGNTKRAAARYKLRHGNSRKVIGVVQPFRASRSGIQPINLPKFAIVWYGKRPAIDLGKSSGSVTGSGVFFAAADSADNEVVFLNSKGDSTDVVPSGDVEGVEAGQLTALAYVESGETYEPVITMASDDAGEDLFDTVASVDVSTGSDDNNGTGGSTGGDDGGHETTNANAEDAKIQELAGLGYVSRSDYATLLPAAFNTTPTQTVSGDVASYAISLKFDVRAWRVLVGSYPFTATEFEGSAGELATIQRSTTSSKDATIDIDKSTFASGDHQVVLGVKPVGAGESTDYLSYTLGTVKGTKVATSSNDWALGSSGGGCSTSGLAVLAMAVLGSFVLTRKR